MNHKELQKIPDPIDSHAHLRDFDEAPKETWETGTRAAISGGVVTVIAMPNTKPSVVTPERLAIARKVASENASCDWGVYYGATAENVGEYEEKVVEGVLGLKIYLNSTHGQLLLSDPKIVEAHLRLWPKNKPVLVHAEGETVLQVLEMIKKNPRPVHFCHVSLADEIEWVKKGKEAGLPITCEVTPHHLFLTENDEKVLGPFGRMKPQLRTARDVDALWRNLDVVDTIGSDHAPHTKEEKLGATPPFGVPGIETMLPLILTAVAEGKLSLDRMVELTSTNPARIFGIKKDANTYTEVDLEERYLIRNENLMTKCGWSPFDGIEVTGRIKSVYIRGIKVFDGEKILVQPGFGKEVVVFRP